MSEELMTQYLKNDQVIKALEVEQKQIKDQLWKNLEAGQFACGKVWEYDGLGQVCLVKGRAGKKTLNRSKLVLQGVTAEQIEAATDEGKTGSPHLRVERPKE